MAKKKAKAKAKDIRIVILQRGWVMVGEYHRDGEDCSLTGAHVIRQWGTSKGLGELAACGPLPATKLDACNGKVEFHRLTEVATLAADPAKWISLCG